MTRFIEKIRLGILAAAIAALLISTSAIALQPETYSLVGMDCVRTNDPNLTGKGVKICVVERSENYQDYMPLYDYKPDTDNPILKNANIVTTADIAKLNQSKSFHSTAICSILSGSFAGDSSDGYSAPLKDAKMYLYEFWEFIVDYLLTEGAKIDADVLSASFGTPLPQWWTMGMQYIVARDNVVAVASVGNGGEIFADCLYPAAGANFIAVGVADRRMMPLCESVMLEDVAQSSYGNTEFGRMKPDIVAPGNYLVADIDGGVAQSGSYSSYAAPAVAAVAGLLIQKALDNGFTAAAGNAGSSCVIKAILLNSAAKGAGWHKGDMDIKDDHLVPMDTIQGCGILDAAAAYDQLTAGQVPAGSAGFAGWDNNVVNGRTENTYRISTTPGTTRYISATLVWNREFQPSYPFEYDAGKNINLRLELWAIDPNNPQNNRLVDFSDSPTDNIEHIFCPVGAARTEYQLIVVFSDSEDAAKIDMTQRYGLAFSTVQMPKQWQGQWLDLNADGDITIDDIKSMVLTSQASPKPVNPAVTQEKLNSIRILLNEITKKGRLE